MELQEIVNFQMALKLNALTLNQYTQLYKKATNKRDEEGKDSDLKAEFTKLKNYCGAIISSNNKLSVKYGFTEGKDFGRLQSKTESIQRIFNGFRGLLCNGITYDLDMKNAHPCILRNICEEFQIDCPQLNDYIKNRSEWIQELMETYRIDKYTAKATLLTMMNKDTLTTEINGKKIKSKPAKFVDFDKEMKTIQSLLFISFKKDYYKYVKNESFNQKGKLMNLLLCEIENRYLNKAKELLESKKVIPHSLMYDGLQIYCKDKKDKDIDLDKIIDLLNNDFIAEKIEWTQKEHNIELLNSLEEMDIKQRDTIITDNIEDITDHMLNGVLKNKIYRTEIGVVYLSPSKLITNEKDIDAELYRFITDQDYNMYEDKGKDEPKITKASKTPKYIKEMIHSIISKAPKNNNFIQTIWNNTRFKLFFRNGIYDFKQNKFISGEFNETPIKIDRDYNDVVSLESYSDLYTNILNPIFSIRDSKKDTVRVQLLEFFLHRIARIMAGHIEDKKWLLLEGLRNSGKGVLTLLLENAFQRYVKVTNSGNFIYKQSSTDEAKKQSWIVDYQFCRLAYTQEITLNSSKKNPETVDGNMIKKFCSGGDSIEARKNHCDEIQFKIQSSLMVCCNDMPEITPKDTEEFCEQYQMKSKFLTKEQQDTEVKIPKYEYYDADDKVKDYVKEDKYIDAFIQLLLSYYDKKVDYPKELQTENENVKDVDDYTKLFDIFTIENDGELFMSNETLREIIIEKKLPFTLNKCKKLLIAKGAIATRTKTERGLGYIRRKEENDDLDEVKDELD